MPNLLDHPSEYKRNSVEARQCTTARRIVMRRAGYEGESLADVALGRKLAKRGMKHARDVDTFVKYSRELNNWIERERILLRIPLPAAVKAIEPRRVAGSVSYSDLPRSGSLVMDEQPGSSNTAHTAQPAPTSSDSNVAQPATPTSSAVK